MRNKYLLGTLFGVSVIVSLAFFSNAIYTARLINKNKKFEDGK
jgi:hypothetical protein|tara:strand:+ start:989 stop:1117 length:129 start_codon:yes stop_codon:yes gene_type:complete